MGTLKKHLAIYWGICITVLFLLFGYAETDFLDTLERKFYDIRMSLRSNPESESKIILVDIDDESIEKIGRWPWPRSHIAKCLEIINQASPKVIGLNIIYSEPEDTRALKEIGHLADYLTQIDPEQTDKKISKALQAINDAYSRLDNDKKLSQALEQAENVVLPVFFKESEISKELKDDNIRAILEHQSVRKIENSGNLTCPRGNEILTPIPDFFKISKGIGHVNLDYDIDGKVRWEQLLYEYQGFYIPSFTLRLAAISLDVPSDEIHMSPDASIVLNLLEIPTDSSARLLVSFKGPQNSFKRYPFYDVENNKIPPNVFRDKIVLITPSAAGVLNPISTPAAQVMSVGEFSANVIWAMLNRKFVLRPSWDNSARFLMIIMLGLLITFILPRLKAVIAAMSFVLFLVFLITTSTYLFVSRDLWIQITYPLLQWIVGYIGVVTIKYFVTETRKEKIETESAETNRMLGLSFQNQGQLDLAFDKFRKVPVDNEMKRILYNLGLDYERKRQLNKAASVYEYIEEYDSDYKDVSTRKRKLVQASETMVFGDGFLTGGTGGNDFLTSSSDTRPTLGRYEVIKQLGKGAMGVVYLGQDPRINRTTAIKTFRFSDDFDPKEAEAMKQKFFREAESAGTLSHPNIVTIYDAGDEHDLAYIAMEFLEGEDLQKYTKKRRCCPCEGYLIMWLILQKLWITHMRKVLFTAISNLRTSCS